MLDRGEPEKVFFFLHWERRDLSVAYSAPRQPKLCEVSFLTECRACSSMQEDSFILRANFNEALVLAGIARRYRLFLFDASCPGSASSMNSCKRHLRQASRISYHSYWTV